MLSKQSIYQLEKLQYAALKIVFGYDKTHSRLLELANIPTLEERRNTLFDSFCRKIYENRRFKELWLEERVFEGPEVRRQKIVKEKFAKTSRLFKSPLYSIRRRINDLYVT